MEAPKPEPGSRHPILALSMLALGAIGHLAWLYISYNRSRPFFSEPWTPALVWLSTVSIACWAVLLVRPGRRRVLVGVMATIAAILFVYLSDVAFSRWFADSKPPARAQRSDRVPRRGDVLVLPATLQDLDGKPLDLAAYGDRPILVNLWRSWCEPCRREMPDLHALDGTQTHKGDLAVLGFNDEPLELQQQARNDLGVGFRLIVHDEGLPELAAAAFPTTLLVHKGKIIDRWTGMPPDLPARVEQALSRID